MELEKRELTLHTGQQVWYEYDREGDLLEIIFRQATATCAVELTESIILHFDWETGEPLSLTLISFSHLVQPAEYGTPHFRLLVEEWPEEAQDKVWAMLQQAPLNEFLSVGSYLPSHSRRSVPLASIKRPHMASLAA